MTALITGGGGQLAFDLQRLLGDGARALTREELDVCDAAAVERACEEVRPTLLINCAALHDVDGCESRHERAWKVNVEAVANLARQGIPLVHISTNYVFDGRAADPYRETDAPSPRSLYALTKLAGEYAALAYGKDALVVRTAGLYGLRGSASKGGNFVQRMLVAARERGTLRVVDDQRLQPTFTADLAAAILAAVDAGVRDVVHLTAAGGCSWFEFTRAIMEIASVDVPLEPVATANPPGKADRPLNGVLARERADAAGLAPLRGWREALVDYMRTAGLAADGGSPPTLGPAR